MPVACRGNRRAGRNVAPAAQEAVIRLVLVLVRALVVVCLMGVSVVLSPVEPAWSSETESAFANPIGRALREARAWPSWLARAAS